MRTRISIKKRVGALALSLCAMASIMAGGAVTPVANAAAASTNPADWLPWHLTSTDQFRPDAPPGVNSRTTKLELRQIRAMQADLTKAQKRSIKKWNDGPASVPWTEFQLETIMQVGERPPFAARQMRYLHTALYDSMLAAYDARRAFKGSSRPAPYKVDDRIDKLTAGGQTYVPVEAAMAGAAETVLKYLYPSKPSFYFDKAVDQALNSRIYAGVNYPSDVTAARAIGNAIGAMVVEEAKADGIANSTVAYPRPTATDERGFPSGGDAENQWQPSPPNFNQPFAGPVGTWKPALMSASNEMVTADIPGVDGPMLYGSPEFIEAAKEVVKIQEDLTPDQTRIAHFWDDPPVATPTPPGHWVQIALDQLDAFPLNTKEAARAFALLAAVEHDAAIAAFGAKYWYWSIRPINAVWRLCNDGTTLLTDDAAAAAPSEQCPYWDHENVEGDGWYPIIETPAFPSWPSGHATFSGSAGKLLGYLFPGAEATLSVLAEEAAMSRLYGGIHFREDNTEGLLMGQWLADKAIARAESDGSGL